MSPLRMRLTRQALCTACVLEQAERMHKARALQAAQWHCDSAIGMDCSGRATQAKQHHTIACSKCTWRWNKVQAHDAV